jgi:hypothetical protein
MMSRACRSPAFRRIAQRTVHGPGTRSNEALHVKQNLSKGPYALKPHPKGRLLAIRLKAGLRRFPKGGTLALS